MSIVLQVNPSVSIMHQRSDQRIIYRLAEIFDEIKHQCGMFPVVMSQLEVRPEQLLQVDSSVIICTSWEQLPAATVEAAQRPGVRVLVAGGGDPPCAIVVDKLLFGTDAALQRTLLGDIARPDAPTTGVFYRGDEEQYTLIATTLARSLRQHGIVTLMIVDTEVELEESLRNIANRVLIVPSCRWYDLACRHHAAHPGLRTIVATGDDSGLPLAVNFSWRLSPRTWCRFIYGIVPREEYTHGDPVQS